MNLLRRTGLIFSLAFAFSLPINATAADEVVAAAPAASAEQPAMQSDAPMHNLMMRERQRMQEPGKCKTMQGAAAVDQDASDPAPGMGMGMGMGKGPCHAGKHCENCKHREHCMQGGNCKQRACTRTQQARCEFEGMHRAAGGRGRGGGGSWSAGYPRRL